MKNLPAPLKVTAQALIDWWDAWISMVIVNLAWILCWLTIVLGPPATFGLYHVTHQLARGESLGLGGLIEGARRYFAKSWLWMLLNLAVTIVIAVDLIFYAQVDAIWVGFLQGTFIVLSLFWLMVQFYVPPFLMEQDNKSLKLALRNGALTLLAAPGYTIVVTGIAVLLIVFSLFLVFPLFMGVPCLITAIGNRAVMERMETYGVREHEEGD